MVPDACHCHCGLFGYRDRRVLTMQCEQILVLGAPLGYFDQFFRNQSVIIVPGYGIHQDETLKDTQHFPSGCMIRPRPLRSPGYLCKATFSTTKHLLMTRRIRV